MILTSSHVCSTEFFVEIALPTSPNQRGRPKTNSPRGTGPVSVTDDYDDDDLTLLQALRIFGEDFGMAYGNLKVETIVRLI